MSNKSKRKRMDKLDSIYKIVLQSSSKGISAREIAKKLKKPETYRTTVHRYLNSLELMGKVYSEKGLWYPKDVKENSIVEKETEITIELPVLDKEEREKEAELRAIAKRYPDETKHLQRYLEAKKELRTIKIRGKNIETIKEELPKIIIETLGKQKSKPFWKKKITLF